MTAPSFFIQILISLGFQRLLFSRFLFLYTIRGTDTTLKIQLNILVSAIILTVNTGESKYMETGYYQDMIQLNISRQVVTPVKK